MNQTSKTEDWLALWLYGAELLLNPSPGKILGGYESVDSRRRFDRHLRRLQQRRLLQSSRLDGRRTFRLTDRGRLLAHGGRDPAERWGRRWDGRWRMVLFDLPSRRQSARVRLIRWLHQQHFGCLQRSVWVHPDTVALLRPALQEWAADAGKATVVEARCAAGFSDTAIVAAAWNFQKINQCYADYLRVASEASQRMRKGSRSGTALARWLRQERAAWLEAVSRDPLLPQVLLPPGYQGRQAAAARQAALAEVQRL